MRFCDQINICVPTLLECLIFTLALHKGFGWRKKRGPLAGLLFFIAICWPGIILLFLVVPEVLLYATVLIFLTLAARYLYDTPLLVAAFFSLSVHHIRFLADLLFVHLVLCLPAWNPPSPILEPPCVEAVCSFGCRLLQALLTVVLGAWF